MVLELETAKSFIKHQIGIRNKWPSSWDEKLLEELYKKTSGNVLFLSIVVKKVASKMKSNPTRAIDGGGNRHWAEW